MKNNLHKNSKNELIDEILKLRKEKEDLEEKIQDLEWEKQNLKWEVNNLELENTDLQWKLNINSNNSSKLSSTETLQKKTQVCNSRVKWLNPRWWVNDIYYQIINNMKILILLSIFKYILAHDVVII